MRKIFYFQILVLLFLLSYPLVYSVFFQKNKIGIYEDTKIYVTDSGMIVKWIVAVKNKPVYFVRALSFRVFKDKFLYFIFDRHSISDDIIQPYLKVNLKDGWPAGFYNYVVLVTYENKEATVLINNREFKVNLIDAM